VNSKRNQHWKLLIFVPDQGQGAGQAIEDAASLAVMLQKGTPLSAIPERLKLYQKCRYERASHIQEISRIAGMDLGSGPPLDASRFTAYNFGHDEWDYSTQVLRKYDWENKRGLIWRMPTSFGPMPGPRQDFHGCPRDGSKATFKSASVKFKSSRTLLQNLFPTERLKFASPDTTVYATLSATQLDNLEWLGGRGYSHFGLYIHGVQYTKDNGETITGTYLPILFENLADPILSGREELGFPKVFADLDVQQDTNTWSLRASWMGSTFASLTLSDSSEPLTNGDAASTPAQGQAQAPAEEGLFFHKHIPTTGSFDSKERAQADATYTAFLPNDLDAKTVERKIAKTLTAKDARISFNALDWKALPTMHHIILRLQEIPVYEVVEAKIVEGTGVSDVSAVTRAD
jgi:hypothetical protein